MALISRIREQDSLTRIEIVLKDNRSGTTKVSGLGNSWDSNLPLRPGQFYGDVLDKHENGGLVLSEFRHDRARRLPKHSHELAFFNLLLQGEYRESYGQKTATLKPFTTIFRPSGETHHDEIGPAGIRIFSIEMRENWLARLHEYGVAPSTVIASPGSELGWLATRLYREYRERKCYSALAIEALVLEMLVFVGRLKQPREKRAPAWLPKVMELIQANFQENLTSKTLAAETGVHPAHLSKVFRQFRHETIGDYVHKLRIQFACQQLGSPEVNLAAIATEAGFADQSHFTRVFKLFTGMTPGAYRAVLTSGGNSL